jgi:hypothetical protein
MGDDNGAGMPEPLTGQHQHGQTILTQHVRIGGNGSMTVRGRKKLD